MKIYLRYDMPTVYKTVLTENLRLCNLDYEIEGWSELEIKGNPSKDRLKELYDSFKNYGIEVIKDPREELVQRISDAVTEMVYSIDPESPVKTSLYLSKKLNYSYPHLSRVFSEFTYMSIEYFVILKKIEYVKKLISETQLSLSEIAYKLNYSSLAHLSRQFKKTTGLTPSAFDELIKKRQAVACS